MVSLSVRNLISIADLSTEEIIAILDRADAMETIVKSGKPSKKLAGKILAALYGGRYWGLISGKRRVFS
ncbi:MAG: hypothetical protein ACXACF_10745 [Candidatus Hermodarchaeia archaeon]